MHRLSPRLLILALVAFFALPVYGQYTRDAAGIRKIDEAINTHYLATDFDKAEAVLTGTIKACEDKCSPQTLAKAWMYVGIVRGSGRNDQAGAKEAFASALALDPNVKLDSGLATPETQATFGNSGGGGAVETPATPAKPAGGEPAAAGGAAGNGLTCTPDVTEVETRRPIPVQCKPDEEVTSIELRYKPFGDDTWKTIKMERKGKSFRGQIPCDATTTPGTLKFYVQGKDPQGEPVVNWGTKSQPNELALAEESSQEPPSFDDADAPARCAVKEICPPDFPGCDSGKPSGGTIDWGGSCGNSTDCKAGLLCMDGTCETAPSCKTTSDCPAGTCVDGKCAVSGGDAPSGPFKKIWVGLHVAQDIAIVGGENICMPGTETQNFSCYLTGTRDIPYDPSPVMGSDGNNFGTGGFGTTAVGRVPTGTVAGTTRILLSFDYAFTANITAGLRAGFAFRGGPPAGMVAKPIRDPSAAQLYTATPPTVAGSAFMPFHFELRGAYWFGKNSLGRAGFRPYVHAGGGLAQVDAKLVVNVSDRDPPGTADAWKKLGRGFVTLGGGLAYAFSPKFAAQANLNAMYMMSASGIVLEPSLGAMMGF